MKWIHIGICLAVSCPSLHGQAFLARRDYNPNGLGVLWSGLAVFDANGDGTRDLVSSSGSIAVFPGRGDGTFAEAPIVTKTGNDQTSIEAISAADLNHDGRGDLVGTAMEPGSGGVLVYGLGVMFGNGDGTFGPMTIYPVNLYGGFRAEQSLLADVNGDGKLDAVLVGSWNTGTGVVVWLGNGDGTFGSPIITTASGVRVGSGLAAADFNGDGKLDLAVATSAGVAVWLGDGTGHFHPGASISIQGGAFGVDAGDLNHDGFADIVAVNIHSSYATILLGRGDGTFQNPARIGMGTCERVAIGDVNGDGIPDLVAAGYMEGALVALGNGDGTFQKASLWFVSSPATSGLVLARLRKGGPLDIVTANGLGGEISVLLNTGAGKFQDGIKYNVSAAGCVAAADFDHDGRQDLAVVNSTGVRILFGTGKAAAPLRPGPTLQTAAGCVFAGDLNNDGIPDLVVPEGTASTPQIDVFLGRSDGTFQPPFVIAVLFAFNNVAIADVNGDGNMDVITSSGSLLLGNGDGTLQSPITLFPTNVDLSWVSAGDLNGDGKADLVFSNSFSGLHVLISNGDGTFRQDTYTAFGAEGTAIADFNGDGILDVAVGSYSWSALVFLGNGDGTLRTGTTIQDPSLGPLLVAADFNNDGKMDLASSNSNNFVLILHGDGNGTFTDTELVGGVAPLYGYAAADLHEQLPGKGGPDLVTAGGNAVVVLINTAK